MYLCAKGVTHVEVWRNCSTWNSLEGCGTVENKRECSTWNTHQDKGSSNSPSSINVHGENSAG